MSHARVHTSHPGIKMQILSPGGLSHLETMGVQQAPGDAEDTVGAETSF